MTGDDSLTLSPANLQVVPIFPLPEAVLFPSTRLPLHVFEPRYRKMIADALAGDRVLGIAHLREGFEADYRGRPPVHSVLGVGKITRDVQLPDGRYNIMVSGILRARIASEHPPLAPYRTVRTEVVADQHNHDRDTLRALERQVAMYWSRLGSHFPEPVRSLSQVVQNVASAGARANRIGDVILTDPDERQAFLEETDPNQRFCLLVDRLHGLAQSLSIDASSGLN